MLKTKLGISIALVWAAMYFLGMFSFIPAVLLAGYVLIAEENEWVKRQAARMIGVVLLFGLLSIAIGWIDEIIGMLNIVVRWFNDEVYLKVPGNLTGLLQYIISIAKDVFLLVMGIMALGMKSIKFPLVDKLLDKFMSSEQ